MFYYHRSFNRYAFCSFFIFLLSFTSQAQNSISIGTLSSFQNPSPTWHVAGGVAAGFQSPVFTLKEGTGVLVNNPDSKTKGADLISSFEHGDADIELDYMMLKGSNSGIYLQGNYEIQLMDSWGVISPTSSDNGAVYQRWDESKPEGQKGYQGYVPRQNVSRAPGLWQHLKVSFQAPRFDAAGKKTENARLLSVELNGILIHENLELLGPTRGALGEEKPTGPLRIQGDHGPVAIRNFTIHQYHNLRPQFSNLKYAIYKTSLETEPDFKTLTPQSQGSLSQITNSMATDLDNQHVVRYYGSLSVKEAGEYSFSLNTPGGNGLLKLNNTPVIALGQRRGRVKETLPKGDVPFELLYTRQEDWSRAFIGLNVSGPGIREFSLSDVNNMPSNEVDQILVDAPNNTILRSFMDIPGGTRITHAISVGSPQDIHYTYDMDNGFLAQAWRGDFLNATPMWHERGDGSSRPSGTVVYFGKPFLSIAKLSSTTATWPTDTVGSGYRPKGYLLDEKDCPQFRYYIYGNQVLDKISVKEGKEGLQRVVEFQNAADGYYVRLASSNNIEEIENGLYLVGNQSYYLKIDDAGGAKPFIRDSNGAKELLVPIKKTLKYSVVF